MTLFQQYIKVHIVWQIVANAGIKVGNSNLIHFAQTTPLPTVPFVLVFILIYSRYIITLKFNYAKMLHTIISDACVRNICCCNSDLASLISESCVEITQAGTRPFSLSFRIHLAYGVLIITHTNEAYVCVKIYMYVYIPVQSNDQ